MSRIYEALQREHGEIADIILPQLHEQPAPPLMSEPESAVDPFLMEPMPPAAAPEALPDLRVSAIRLHGAGPLLPFDGTNPSAAEQYRIIRTRVVQHPKHPQLILITSASPGDGKSVTAINLAAALALKGHDRILLADTDFRRSTIHKHLGLAASPGLTDVLSGAASTREVLVRTEQFPNLFVAAAGEAPPNPSELLDSPRWTALCAELRAEFRYIIADCPPVASVADYELLEAGCDGLVMVARPDHSRRGDLLRALESVPKDKLIGVVMNCVKDWPFSRTHGHGHYYAYYGSALKK